jgi:hypothetical protein|tara:strand:+ start:560 stop:994 length:435 start_codon:yes stop_codon:yes gene_type:complete
MLILQPTAGEKTITIAPRSEYYNSVEARALNDGGIFENSDCFSLFSGKNHSITLRRDGDGKEEIITGVYVSGITNFTQIKFSPTILQEDSTYYIEIIDDGKLLYRDKIYVTSQTSSQMLVEKHSIGNNTIYKPFSESDDNTYII